MVQISGKHNIESMACLLLIMFIQAYNKEQQMDNNQIKNVQLKISLENSITSKASGGRQTVTVIAIHTIEDRHTSHWDKGSYGYRTRFQKASFPTCIIIPAFSAEIKTAITNDIPREQRPSHLYP